MTGERNLGKLLSGMMPTVAHQDYVYCCFTDHQLPENIQPICQFRESEGLTAIVEKSVAESFGIPYTFETRMITLTIHSDLAAIGFLATICTALAKAGISCNLISAYYHDHLFVPLDRVTDTMDVLRSLSTSAEMICAELELT